MRAASSAILSSRAAKSGEGISLAGPGLGSPRGHFELVRERQNGSVCVVDGFGARVERKASGVNPPHPPADALPCLQNENVGSRLHEAIGSDEAGESGPDDGDPH